MCIRLAGFAGSPVNSTGTTVCKESQFPGDEGIHPLGFGNVSAFTTPGIKQTIQGAKTEESCKSRFFSNGCRGHVSSLDRWPEAMGWAKTFRRCLTLFIYLFILNDRVQKENKDQSRGVLGRGGGGVLKRHSSRKVPPSPIILWTELGGASAKMASIEVLIPEKMHTGLISNTSAKETHELNMLTLSF